MKSIQDFVNQQIFEEKTNNTKHMTISSDTIDEIYNFFSNYSEFDDLDVYDGDYQSVDVEDAEFTQGNYDIIVSGNVTARLEKEYRSNDYDVPNDPACFYNAGFEITDVAVYDEDGEDAIADNADEVLDLYKNQR